MKQQEDTASLWLDGEITLSSKAQVPITTVAVAGSTSVFEGIRGYWDAGREQLWVFRLGDHMRRFQNSMALSGMDCGFSPDQLVDAAIQLLRANEAREDSYVRPLAFLTGGKFFVSVAKNRTATVLIETMPFQSGLGMHQEKSCCVSSWTRIADNVMPPRVKCAANYQNSRLAVREAWTNGYDDAIFLTREGKVAECTGSCLFVVREGVAITSPVTGGILESITRATLIRLFDEVLGTRVIERNIDRTELYIADEAFSCGTGDEITAITSIDRYPIGDGAIGPATREIERVYHDVVCARLEGYADWCSPVWPIVREGTPQAV
jgi:branched-chain amino acid aminotransferase